MLTRSWERQRLNERPVYLRSLYLGLALLQTGFHLWMDYDKIRGSVEPVDQASTPQESSQTPANPVEQLKSRFPKLLQEIGIISSFSAVIGPIVYSLTVRKTAWRISHACARFLQWDIPSKAELSIIPPYHITLIIRSLISSFCLLLLWRGSNLAFSVYVAQEPVKRDQPLTQDSSDPNGSLINGLRSRKSLVRVRWLTTYTNRADIFGRHSHSGSWQRSARVFRNVGFPSSKTLIVRAGRHGRRYPLSVSK